jgi:ABC-type transport system substrate-binding protein
LTRSRPFRVLAVKKAFRVLILLTIISIPFAVMYFRPVAAQQGPIFNIVLLVPTVNKARIAWATMIQANLESLGINATLVQLPFSPYIFDRALTPPLSNLGKTFDQGGFDILVVGQNLLIDPDPFSLYHSSQFAPSGENYYLWNNSQNDLLTSQVKTTLDHTARMNYLKQWQVLAYNELPSIPIFYPKELVAFDSNFPNAQAIFTAYHFPAWPAIEHLSTLAADASLTFAHTGQAPGEGIIPELSTSYYDLAVSGEIFSSLALRNDTIFKSMIPELAAGTASSPGWSVASDNETWTVNIRPGVTWQDGQPFTADDVKFTFDLYQNDTFGSPTESFVRGVIGGMSGVTETSTAQVVFHLPRPDPLFVQDILTAGILPKHILSNFSNDYSRIRNSLFNRPDAGSGGTLPIGTGPYKYVGFDPVTSTNHLVRNDNYFNFSDWGRSALLAKGQFGVKDYYVTTIIGSSAATRAFSNGQVDVLDGQYHLEVSNSSFVTSLGSSRTAVYDAFGVQEMGVNMRHPILGTGMDTPLGRQDPSKAALAAKYVRQAISHAVPRDQIISQILNGYGLPAITTPVIGDYKTGFSVTEGFNPALAPYSFNLTRARELLQLAGYQQSLPPIDAQFTIRPASINLRAQGKWITGYIQLPAGFNVNRISISSIRLNQTVSVAPGTVPTVVERNGIPTLSVKFSLSQVQALFSGPGTYVLRISGSLGGDPPRTFEGFDSITVSSPSALH